MKINPDMVVLAREYRDLTQEQLSRKLFIGQGRIAKIEGGITADIPDALFDNLCKALEFPADFFLQNEDVLGFGSSAYFYRKKAKISAAERKKIHASINLLRIHLKKMLTSVDVRAKRNLPRADIDEFGGSATKAAQALRAVWGLPDGPVNNLTKLIESAGVIIVEVDFKTRFMDGTSLRLNEMPPVIFMNKDVSGDRWRFTLAHELAHLILHDIPHENMENEADEFAAELLMPERELAPQFARLGKIRLIDLSNLKSYWKCSIAALLVRATGLGFISDNQKRYLWSAISKQGWRLKEPNPIEREVPSTHQKIIDYFSTTLEYGKDEFSKMFKINHHDLSELYASFSQNLKGPHLRVVS